MHILTRERVFNALRLSLTDCIATGAVWADRPARSGLTKL